MAKKTLAKFKPKNKNQEKKLIIIENFITKSLSYNPEERMKINDIVEAIRNFEIKENIYSEYEYFDKLIYEKIINIIGIINHSVNKIGKINIPTDAKINSSSEDIKSDKK